jgi:hypothetical protein
MIKISKPSWLPLLTALCLLAFSGDACLAGGRYVEVRYPGSEEAGELRFGVTYTLWLPDTPSKIRAVLVHQHGCGAGACQGGESAAYDLHWQALAKKWNCALLGPSYHQADGENCRLWCDPRNGSEATFLKALADLAARSQRPELATAPWCLWGHSGGAFWASLMQASHPERIVAIWLRSGTAFAAWEKGEIAKPNFPEAAYQLPVMCNPGAKEKGDARFDGAWSGALAMFRAYRAKGAPIGFAPDPRTSHECGDSRYLAIPFFDACLAMRLPDADATDQQLKPIDARQSWLAAVPGEQAVAADQYDGDISQAGWLPNEHVATCWADYVKTGAVADTTPPSAPEHVTAIAAADGTVTLTWDASADLESGLRAFVVLRDGEKLAQLPEQPVGRFGRPLFQTMSYHDTPERPLPEMRYVDTAAKPSEKHEYAVVAVNSVGLESTAAVAVAAVSEPAAANGEDGWISLFDGASLVGWHKNPERIGHGTGGEWRVEEGAIVGEQDPPGSGNGGILLTGRQFGDFELLIDLKPDWGVDSGLFLRSTERGECFQMMVDYHDAGNVGHIYGEGTGGFNNRPFEILGEYDKDKRLIGLKAKSVLDADASRSADYTISGEGWINAWKLDDWNTARLLCVGQPPKITTWLNDVKVSEFDGATFESKNYDAHKVAKQLGRQGSIALQVHGGMGWPKGATCRWKNIKLKPR